jgi:hypothetical protein
MKARAVFAVALGLISACGIVNSSITGPIRVSGWPADSRVEPCLAIGTVENGTKCVDHIVWGEAVPLESDPTKVNYVSMYRARDDSRSTNEGEKWSEEVEYDNDSGLLRRGDFQAEGTHIAVSRNPFDPDDDEHNNTASAVFFHRNRGFYLGTEQAAVFYCHNIQADWGEGYNPPHLQCISGMAEHIKDPFIIFNPHTSINGTIMNNFMVFWSQHERMSDLDHDISYNFRYTDEDDLTGWQYVQRATVDIYDPSSENQYKSEFFPSVAINNSYLSGDEPNPTLYTGDIYVVSYDYCGAEGQDLLYSEYDASEGEWIQVEQVMDTADPPAWNTDDSYETSVAYAFKEDSSPAHFVYLLSNHVFSVSGLIDAQLRLTLKNPDDDDSWQSPVDLCRIAVGIHSRPAIAVDSNSNLYILQIARSNYIYLKRCAAESDAMDPESWYRTLLWENDSMHEYASMQVDPVDDERIHIVFTEVRGDGGIDVFWLLWSEDENVTWEPFDWEDEFL